MHRPFLPPRFTIARDLSPALLGFLAAASSPPAFAQDSRLQDLQTRQFKVNDQLTYPAQVGRLKVRENRANPDAAREIEIAFVRLKCPSKDPCPPLIYLSGGPGAPATPLAASEIWAPFLEIADVILLDQRGCGRSLPELSFKSEQFHSEYLFADFDTAIAHALEIAELAADHFRKLGIDLSCYQTRESAADVDELRAALGLRKVSIMGHSYGTHLGLEVVRRFGPSVDRFISVGTSGTNDMHQLPAELDERVRRLSKIIAADPRIGRDMPDFFGAVKELFERSEREPIELEIAGAGGAAMPVSLGRLGMAHIILRDMGDTADLPVLPRLVHQCLKGDTTLLCWFAQKRIGGFADFPTLLHVNRASSGATADRWKRIERQAPDSLFGMMRCMFSPEIDPVLGVVDLGDEFREPVESAVPALFISGTLDANTPPEQTERARAGFTNSAHVTVENGGHEDLLEPPEVRGLVRSFLRGAKVTDRLVKAPPLRFALLEGPDPSVSHPSMPGTD